MNEIVNEFSLADDKFLPEMHLRQPASLMDHLQETKKEYRNLQKQEIHDIFIKMNKIKLLFNMTWLMEILKI